MQRNDLSHLDTRDPTATTAAPRARWSRTWHFAWALPAGLIVAAQPTSSATWVATTLLAAAVLVLNADGLAPRR